MKELLTRLQQSEAWLHSKDDECAGKDPGSVSSLIVVHVFIRDTFNFTFISHAHILHQKYTLREITWMKIILYSYLDSFTAKIFPGEIMLVFLSYKHHSCNFSNIIWIYLVNHKFICIEWNNYIWLLKTNSTRFYLTST